MPRANSPGKSSRASRGGLLAIAVAGILAIAWWAAPSAFGAEDAAAQADTSSAVSAGKLFAELDANRDGQLAEGEVSEEKQRLFQRLVRTADKNGDGRLSRDEFVAGLAAQQPAVATAGPTNGSGTEAPPDALRERAARFKQLDANSDGKIQLEEFPEQGRPFFERLLDDYDEDGDGAMSIAEFRKAGPTLRRFAEQRAAGPPLGWPPLFVAIDTNGDGVLNAEEIEQASTAIKKLDRNRDGSITPDEVGAPPGFPGFGSLQGGPRQGGPPPGLSTGDETKAARAPGSIDVMLDTILRADANGDGKISAEEAPQRLQKRFAKIDKNNDRQLDQDELRAYLTAMRDRLGDKFDERSKALGK